DAPFRSVLRPGAAGSGGVCRVTASVGRLLRRASAVQESNGDGSGRRRHAGLIPGRDEEKSDGTHAHQQIGPGRGLRAGGGGGGAPRGARGPVVPLLLSGGRAAPLRCLTGDAGARLEARQCVWPPPPPPAGSRSLRGRWATAFYSVAPARFSSATTSSRC